MDADIVIVGSGASGIAAASAIDGRDVLMLDVGLTPSSSLPFTESVKATMRLDSDLGDVLLGPRFEALQNVVGPYLSPKLKSSYMRFVTASPPGLPSVKAGNFRGHLSYACGGLANAWGAGTLRFTDAELQGCPLSVADLDDDYDALTDLMGISGDPDGDVAYEGSSKGLQPPMLLDPLGQDLLRRARRQSRFLAQNRLRIKRVRHAVLTKPHADRSAYDYSGTDFFHSEARAVYNPRWTLEALRAGKKNFRYRPSVVVNSFRELPDRVKIQLTDIGGGGPEALTCRELILAAGALGSARIVLASAEDTGARLPFLESPISFVPLLAPTRIGHAQADRYYGGSQIYISYDHENSGLPIQASFYGLDGVLRSDILINMPFTAAANLMLLQYLASALAVVQVFYPSLQSSGQYVQLCESGDLRVECLVPERGSVERHLLRCMRRLGFWGSSRLIEYPPPGNSYHYAGTLPMRERPGMYETDVSGRLAGTTHVHVADASVLSVLPAKGHTFTVMANARRVARQVANFGCRAGAA